MEKWSPAGNYAVNTYVPDEKDLRILHLLQQNGKATVREIASEVHLSPTPVHERIRRLEELGFIKQYAALVDHNKVGRGLIVICYVSLKEHSKKSGLKFIKVINELVEVAECFNISGEFDFMLKVMVANMDAYYDFHVNKLGQLENIGQLQSTFVMGVIKDSHIVVR